MDGRRKGPMIGLFELLEQSQYYVGKEEKRRRKGSTHIYGTQIDLLPHIRRWARGGARRKSPLVGSNSAHPSTNSSKRLASKTVAQGDSAARCGTAMAQRQLLRSQLPTYLPTEYRLPPTTTTNFNESLKIPTLSRRASSGATRSFSRCNFSTFWSSELPHPALPKPSYSMQAMAGHVYGRPSSLSGTPS